VSSVLFRNARVLDGSGRDGGRHIEGFTTGRRWHGERESEARSRIIGGKNGARDSTS
jgi:hypothetical protein